MAPRWLKPVGSINSPYSSITFAISNPDGSITSALMMGRAALFGKEVIIEKWIDKPPLIQCSKCHALSHMKSLKACPLDKDSVRCHICRSAHRSDEHDQRCPHKHAIAGVSPFIWRNLWHTIKQVLCQNTTESGNKIPWWPPIAPNTSAASSRQGLNWLPYQQDHKQICTRPIQAHLDDCKVGLGSWHRSSNGPVCGLPQSRPPPTTVEGSSCVHHP